VERKSFLQLLFGGSKKSESKANTPSRTSRVKRTQSRAAPAAPPAPKIEKLENARKILVLGDFIANGAADGLLREAFAEAPGSLWSLTGPMVPRDWFATTITIGRTQAPAIVERGQPSIIVVQIGSNDRQQLAGQRRYAKRCAPQLASRIRTPHAPTHRLLRARNTPLLWVGLPSL
jgi:hypothetical protein